MFGAGIIQSPDKFIARNGGASFGQFRDAKIRDIRKMCIRDRASSVAKVRGFVIRVVRVQKIR